MMKFTMWLLCLRKSCLFILVKKAYHSTKVIAETPGYMAPKILTPARLWLKLHMSNYSRSFVDNLDIMCIIITYCSANFTSQGVYNHFRSQGEQSFQGIHEG